MPKVISFADAIDESGKACKKRHLLLGNGFSIACRPKIFTYGSLFEQADFTSTPHLKSVFAALDTTDFEQVIKTLEEAAKAIPVYLPSDKKIAAQMVADAEILKDILIQTVANNHPNIPNEIDDEQFWSCRRFLSHFLGPANDGKVYTLNYDLLLYWTLMHEDMPFADAIELNTNDGFGRDEDTEPEYVNWMGESNAHHQRVYYLHGALHLFDAGAELLKYTWVNTGKRLLDQAREAMNSAKFPLFVAEGKSLQKLGKIKHSAHLHHCYKSFSSQMDQKNQALFIFGHSLADNDVHVLKKIARGKVSHLYVGLFGDPSSEINKKIITSAEAIVRKRGDRIPLALRFFDSASANVWGT